MSFWRRRQPPATSADERELALRIAEERERIYADLHDDIGARLLEIRYAGELEVAQALAREALEDLRDIVSRTQAIEGNLREVLAMVRTEAQRRLSARGVDLIWEAGDDRVQPVPLDRSQALQLFRIFREAISNALRHAAPQRLRVRAFQDADEAIFDITDDGPGMPAEPASGRGTRNIEQRAQALGGQAAWTDGTEGGTKVVLRLPLTRGT